MQYYAGIDISLEQSSVCVVDAAGKITKEAKIASDPCVLATFFKGLGFPVTRIGFEAGPLSHWLYAGLTQAGFDVVLLETRHVKAALSAMVVKTDRKDARGIAAAADELVSSGALQVAAVTRAARAADRAQAVAEQGDGCGAGHPWHVARVWSEARADQPRPVRRPDQRADC